MSVEKVKQYLSRFGKDGDVLILTESTATVQLAAEAIHVAPDQIAKSLTFRNGEGCILVVMSGDARVDNQKFKEAFSLRAKMCKPDEVEAYTGHEVGGVCPFAVSKEHTLVYLDNSLKRYGLVYPAAGDANSMVPMTLDELWECSGAVGWVEITK